jgi:hypothetical protein
MHICDSRWMKGSGQLRKQSRSTGWRPRLPDLLFRSLLRQQVDSPTGQKRLNRCNPPAGAGSYSLLLRSCRRQSVDSLAGQKRLNRCNPPAGAGSYSFLFRSCRRQSVDSSARGSRRGQTLPLLATLALRAIRKRGRSHRFSAARSASLGLGGKNTDTRTDTDKHGPTQTSGQMLCHTDYQLFSPCPSVSVRVGPCSSVFPSTT